MSERRKKMKLSIGKNLLVIEISKDKNAGSELKKIVLKAGIKEKPFIDFPSTLAWTITDEQLQELTDTNVAGKLTKLPSQLELLAKEEKIEKFYVCPKDS